MGKKIRVLTKCGEESFYDFDQEVESVEILEEPVFDEPTCQAEVKRLVEHLHGGNWKWSTNTDAENMDFFRYVRWLHNATHKGFTIPENPHDIIIVPYGFASNGHRILGYKSLWIRVGATKVKPKKMLGEHF